MFQVIWKIINSNLIWDYIINNFLKHKKVHYKTWLHVSLVFVHGLHYNVTFFPLPAKGDLFLYSLESKFSLRLVLARALQQKWCYEVLRVLQMSIFALLGSGCHVRDPSCSLFEGLWKREVPMPIAPAHCLCVGEATYSELASSRTAKWLQVPKRPTGAHSTVPKLPAEELGGITKLLF